jgi:hypothetical protein
MASVCEVLAKAGVNMRVAVALKEESGMRLHLVVSDPDLAFQVLEKAGYAAKIAEMVAVVAPDKVGALSETLRFLDSHGIPVEYFYTFVETESRNAVFFLHLPAPSSAVKVLSDAGYDILPPERAYLL